MLLFHNRSVHSYGNRSEEVAAGDGSNINMEMSSMNQSEDDHSGGQEDTRGSS